jgi:hypothetical protein
VGLAALVLLPTAAVARDVLSVWTGGFIGFDLGGGRGTVNVTDTNGGVPEPALP